MNWRITAGGASMLLAASCALDSPSSRMAEGGTAPESWSATRQARAGIDERWVGRIGGSALKSLVAEAQGANPDLRAAAARVDRAAALARGAGAAARPQLDAGFQAARNKQNFIGLPIGGGGVLSSISSNFGTSLNLSWEIDLWGRVRAGEQAALADLESQGQTYRAARSSLAAQVAKAWLALAEANEQIRLAEESLKIRRDTAELIRGRFENAGADEGGASAAQLRLAETDVAAAEAVIAQRRGDADLAQRQLEILLGRYPDARITGAAELPAIPSSPPAGLPSELLLRRPDLLAAERRLAAAGKRKREADLAFFPSFPLTASAGTASGELGSVLDSQLGVWSIAGRVAQPILSGGALSAQAEARGAEEREALATLQQTVLRAFGEVESALAADRFLAERESSTREALDMAIDGAKSAEEDFARGTGDVLTLLQAQSRRIDLATQEAGLRRLRLDNRVNLHLALGGDFRL